MHCSGGYIYRRAYVHRYCACAALRANVAGQIGNRFSPCGWSPLQLMARDTGSYFIDNTDYEHHRAITATSVADSVLGLLLEI